MTFFTAALDPLTRQTVTVDDGQVVHSGSSKIAEMVQVIDGGLTPLLVNAVINRFATEIQKTTPDGVALEGIETNGFSQVSVASQKAAVVAGLHTIASAGTFSRVAEIRANQFSAGSVYVYPDGDTFADDLQSARALAHHDRRMSRLDLLAAVGSAGMLVKADSLGYTYDTFDPAKIWVVFGERLESTAGKAQVDTNNIEHASIIVLQLDGGSDTKKKYVAYFARQDDYPNGRLVEYEAEEWKSIPDPGRGGSDWIATGEWTKDPKLDQSANPMTIQGGLYEYPIITWQLDSTADGTTLFPITGTALYDQSFEIDIETSRIAESAGRSASGAWFGTDPNNLGFSGVINEGMTMLQRDQTASLLSHAASNSKDALAVINSIAESTAKRFHVPGYMVSNEAAMSVTSGYMLDVLNMPLVWDREKRTEINRSSMARKFQIEKQLANFVQGSDVIPTDATEAWTPKPLEFPSDPAATADWQKHLLETGLASLEDLYVEMGKADSIEAATKLIEEVKARAPVVEPEPAPAPTGIRDRLGLGR